MRGIHRSGAASLLACALAAPCAHGATLHTDDFQEDDASWTNGGFTVTRETSGGPDGAGDAFLSVDPFRHLATHNTTPAWTGDFAAIGAAAVTADLMAPPGSAPLSVRLVLFGPGVSPSTSPRWTSTVAMDVPADGEWRNYEFSLAEEDLTLVVPSATYEELMRGVLRVMLRHQPGAPSATTTSVDGTLGVDNLTLAGPMLLSGDYNDDGVVDTADYAAWRDNLGGPAGTLPNDTHDGPIGSDQYAAWRAAYGAAATPAAAAPEPSGRALFLLAATAAVSVCGRSGRAPRASELAAV